MTLDDLENEANGVLGRALGPIRRLLELAYQRGRAAGLEEAAEATYAHGGFNHEGITNLLRARAAEVRR